MKLVDLIAKARSKGYTVEFKKSHLYEPSSAQVEIRKGKTYRSVGVRLQTNVDYTKYYGGFRTDVYLDLTTEIRTVKQAAQILGLEA